MLLRHPLGSSSAPVRTKCKGLSALGFWVQIGQDCDHYACNLGQYRQKWFNNLDSIAHIYPLMSSVSMIMCVVTMCTHIRVRNLDAGHSRMRCVSIWIGMKSVIDPAIECADTELHVVTFRDIMKSFFCVLHIATYISL